MSVSSYDCQTRRFISAPESILHTPEEQTNFLNCSTESISTRVRSSINRAATSEGRLSLVFGHMKQAVSNAHCVRAARSYVDFFVALLYLSVVFGFACLVLGVIEHFNIDLLLLSVPAFALATLCYSFAIRAVDASNRYASTEPPLPKQL
jgi:hypothetical protein